MSRVEYKIICFDNDCDKEIDWADCDVNSICLVRDDDCSKSNTTVESLQDNVCKLSEFDLVKPLNLEIVKEEENICGGNIRDKKAVVDNKKKCDLKVDKNYLKPVEGLAAGSLCKALYKNEGWFKAKIFINKRGLIYLEWLGYNDRTKVFPGLLVIPISKKVKETISIHKFLHSYVIGSKGCNAKNLIENTNCRIVAPPLDNQCTNVSIIGNCDSEVKTVIKRIKDFVQVLLDNLVIVTNIDDRISWKDCLNAIKPLILNVKKVYRTKYETKYYLSDVTEEDLNDIIEVTKTNPSLRLISDNNYMFFQNYRQEEPTRILPPDILEGNEIEFIQLRHYDSGSFPKRDYAIIKCGEYTYIVDIENERDVDTILIKNGTKYEVPVNQYDRHTWSCNFMNGYQFNKTIYTCPTSEITRANIYNFRDINFRSSRFTDFLQIHSVYKSEWSTIDEDNILALHLIIAPTTRLQLKVLKSLHLPEDIMSLLFNYFGECQDIYLERAVFLRQGDKAEIMKDNCGCERCVNSRFNVFNIPSDDSISPYFLENRQVFPHLVAPKSFGFYYIC